MKDDYVIFFGFENKAGSDEIVGIANSLDGLVLVAEHLNYAAFHSSQFVGLFAFDSDSYFMWGKHLYSQDTLVDMAISPNEERAVVVAGSSY